MEIRHQAQSSRSLQYTRMLTASYLVTEPCSPKNSSQINNRIKNNLCDKLALNDFITIPIMEKLSGYWKTPVKNILLLRISTNNLVIVWEFYPRSILKMFYKLKTTLRDIYGLDITHETAVISFRACQLSFCKDRIGQKNTTEALSISIHIARQISFSSISGITFVLIVLGEIISWSLLKKRTDTSQRKVYSIQLICFWSISCSQSSVWLFCYNRKFSMTLAFSGQALIFYQTVISFNV